MTFTYTDETSSRLEIKMPHPKGFLIGIEGLAGEYANIVVQNDAAPELALEILKAAGIDMDHQSAGLSMAFTYLKDAVGLMEAAKSVTARERRRAEVCKELGAFYTPGAPDQPLLRAIDRIIELEQQASK